MAGDFNWFDPPPGHNPYDVKTWGTECGKGIKYKDLGSTTDGQKTAVRKISTGRKARGSSSGDLLKQERRMA